MFHSVGNEKSNWYRNWLSVSLEHFEKFCKYLQTNNYTTHTLDEWYEYCSINKKKENKKLVLTFDDGYLDNWVYVYPILKKYKLKGTIFINPEFVDPTDQIRENLENVNYKYDKIEKSKSIGFLNWNEIKIINESRVMDIQSHSMSHNFYFKSNKIIDIYTGQKEYDWINWFLTPLSKPFYTKEDQSIQIPYGYPIFEFGRALGLRRYFPDEEFIKKCIIDFKGTNNVKFFLQTLNRLLITYPGYYESDDEMEKRFRYEIYESKIILEDKLKKRINFLCWPGGIYNELSFKLALDAGYKATTLGSYLGDNINICEHKKIERIGLSSFIKTKKGYYYVKNKFYLIKLLKSRTGNLFLKIYLKIKKEIFKFIVNSNLI
ncbi:MAG: polysaccharide deacetylase family protein [Bacteroidota bacterium]